MDIRRKEQGKMQMGREENYNEKELRNVAKSKPERRERTWKRKGMKERRIEWCIRNKEED